MPSNFHADSIANKSRSRGFCILLWLRNIHPLGCLEKAAISHIPYHLCVSNPCLAIQPHFAVLVSSSRVHHPVPTSLKAAPLYTCFSGNSSFLKVWPELQNSGKESAELQDKWGASGRPAPNSFNLLDQYLLSKYPKVCMTLVQPEGL